MHIKMLHWLRKSCENVISFVGWKMLGTFQSQLLLESFSISSPGISQPICDFQATFLCIQHTVSKWFKAKNSSWWVCCDWLKRQKCLSFGSIISLVCWNGLVSWPCVYYMVWNRLEKINLPISLQNKQNSVLGFAFDFKKFILWIVQPLQQL